MCILNTLLKKSDFSLFWVPPYFCQAYVCMFVCTNATVTACCFFLLFIVYLLSLILYRKSYFEDLERSHHRWASLRLMMSAEKLLHWALDSALPPTTLVNAMQLAQLDPAVELFYPELSKNIDVILEVSG